MKNLFVLVLAAVTLVSCNNVEQHRTAIEEVSTMWSEFNPKMDALSQVCNLKCEFESYGKYGGRGYRRYG